MPATIQRTVNWTGTNTTQDPNFVWVNVNSVNWVTRADSSTVNQSDFTIADNNTGAVRTSQWEVRHWNYVNDNTLVDSFTITQDADGAVATTTTPPTTSPPLPLPVITNFDAYALATTELETTWDSIDNATSVTITWGTGSSYTNVGSHTLSSWVTSADNATETYTITGLTANTAYNVRMTATNAEGASVEEDRNATTLAVTTNAPINYTLTLGSGTSGAQAVQFTEASPNSQSINYTQSPNSGTPAVLVDSLPAWLTSGGITGSVIQLSLNPDSSTYPADSVGFSMTYRHGDAPVGQGEDELYVDFVAAPSNSILVTSTNATVDSEASNGEGGSTYTDNNSSNSATQSATYTLSLDPDVTLTSSEVYWSDTLPSTSGHQATPTPYWATGLTINNTPSSGQAQISYSHVDPNALAINAPLTDEQAGTQATPGTILLTNQRYVIARHPDDTSHWVAILVTAPNDSITTTQAPVTRTFTWDGATVTGYSTDYPISFVYDGTQAELLDGSFSIDNGTGVATSMSSDHPGNLSFNSSTNQGTAYFRFLADDPEGTVQEDIEIRWTKPSYVTLTSNSSGNSSSFASDMITWTPTCVVENEPILMADGTTKLVQDIVLGDELASLNIATLGNEEDAYKTWSTGIESFSATGTTATVTRFSPGQYTKYMNFNSGALKITHEHPVLIDRAGTVQFISAGTVQVGDKFYQDQTGWVEITSAEEVNETVKTYMIGCEDADVFYANGILVHNIEEEIIKE